MSTAKILASEQVSPSFQRVTVGGAGLGGYQWRGFDQWFRLFLPAPGADLTLPTVSGRAWFRSYLSIPKDRRPHCANYTAADFRPDGAAPEMDINVVLHWDHDGKLGGRVAEWAVSAEVGSPLGLLDQGVMFNPPPQTGSFLLVAEQTGLPAVRGILRDLPANARGTAVIELPTEQDVAWFTSSVTIPAEMSIHCVYPQSPGDTPGAAALAKLQTLPAPEPDAYAFIVGESHLAAGGRRTLRRLGLDKDRICFKGFWRHHPHKP
jgi:NADPH-dependent ferric siderophore reductase